MTHRVRFVRRNRSSDTSSVVFSTRQCILWKRNSWLPVHGPRREEKTLYPLLFETRTEQKRGYLPVNDKLTTGYRAYSLLVPVVSSVDHDASARLLLLLLLLLRISCSFCARNCTICSCLGRLCTATQRLCVFRTALQNDVKPCSH